MYWSIPENVFRDDLIDNFFLAVGKANHIAVSFERSCKYVWRIAHLDHAFSNKTPEMKFDDVVKSIGSDRQLYVTLNEIVKITKSTDGVAEILERARVGRNFVAHDGALSGIYEYRDRAILEKKIFEKAHELRSHIRNLAIGDDLISRWIYEISEKEPPYKSVMAGYPENVEAWVFQTLANSPR